MGVKLRLLVIFSFFIFSFSTLSFGWSKETELIYLKKINNSQDKGLIENSIEDAENFLFNDLFDSNSEIDSLFLKNFLYQLIRSYKVIGDKKGLEFSIFRYRCFFKDSLYSKLLPQRVKLHYKEKNIYKIQNDIIYQNTSLKEKFILYLKRRGLKKKYPTTF